MVVFLFGDWRYESQAAADTAMAEEEDGETGESVGWSRRESRCRAKFVEGCESEAVRGEARRDEIRCSRDEAQEARRAE